MEQIIAVNPNQFDLSFLPEFFRPAIVPSGRKYWLVRANSGIFYETFTSENYIAIGYNEICYPHQLLLPKDDLQKVIADAYSGLKPRTCGRVATQILKFANEIKSGDIVLIPSVKSSHIAFCEVISSDVEFYEKTSDDDLQALIESENDDDDDDDDDDENTEIKIHETYYVKRKPIRLIKKLRASALDPTLYLLLHSHHTISEANNYSHLIERTLNNFYLMDDNIHFVIDAGKTDNNHAADLITGLSTIVDLINVYNEINHTNLDRNTFALKINIQSKGKAEFIGSIAKPTIIIGALAIVIFGGNFTIKNGAQEITFGTEGFKSMVIELIKESNRHEEATSGLVTEKAAETPVVSKPSQATSVEIDAIIEKYLAQAHEARKQLDLEKK